MALSFSAYVTEWTRQSEARMLAVFKRAVELLADELTYGRQNGGRVPWVTGNMARSLTGMLNGLVQTAEGAPAGDAGAAIAMAQIGDFIHLGFQAGYSKRVNFGFVGQDSLGRNYNQEGAHFVEYAATQWPVMVALAAEEIQAMVSA